MAGCHNLVWTLWKGDNILHSLGIEPSFFGLTVHVSFSISVLLRLTVVEGAEPMT
jgi:hypothetical protein